MLYWVILSVAVIAIIVIVVIVLRHWKEIRLLNPESIQEERERKKRDELILHRFERMKSEKFAPLRMIFQRIITGVKKWYHGIYLRLVKLEKFYTQAKTPFAFISPTTKDRIKSLLDDARALVRDQKLADAERRYLEVLAIDKRNWDAYKGLGLIYLKQKMYPQARETFEFLDRSNKADDISYAGLAEIAEAEGDLVKSEAMRRRAIEVRPRLANRHAELAALHIAQSFPHKALPFARRAVELDPKSSKYLELFIDTAILVGDRNEARRRYDQLRLVSEDRPKLQAIKDRIDGMS